MLHLPVPGIVELDAKGGAVGGGLLLVGATAHVRGLGGVLLARNREEQGTQRRAAFSTRDTENRPKICLDKPKSSHEETEGAEFTPPNLLKVVNTMLAPCMLCVCPMYVCVWLFGTKIQNPLFPRKHSAVFIFHPSSFNIKR